MSYDMNILVSGSSDKKIIVWDLKNGGEKIWTLTSHTGTINSVNLKYD